MITFREFLERIDILEANKHGIPEDEYQQWRRDRAEGRGPAKKTFNGVEYVMRGKGIVNRKKTWGVSTVASRTASSQKRRKAEQESQLSKDELRAAAGGDEERAALAQDAEETGIRKVKQRTRRIQKATGVPQSLGHKVPVQPDDPSPEDPGHSLSNMQPERLGPNAAKGNRRPKPGEPGYGLTRTQATQDAVRRGHKLGKNIDRELDLDKQGKPSRAARLLSFLRRPKPRDTGAAQRMAAAYDRRVGKSFNH